MIPQGAGRHFEVAHQLEKLHIVRRVLSRSVMEEIGLHPGQLPILEYIHCNPGCTQVEVAQALCITPSSVAQSTKRMQREGLLEKRTSDESQRSKQLRLTEKGTHVAYACREGFDALDAELFAGFGNEELAAFSGYLNRLLHTAAQRASLDIINMDFHELIALRQGLRQQCGERRHREC